MHEIKASCIIAWIATLRRRLSGSCRRLSGSCRRFQAFTAEFQASTADSQATGFYGKRNKFKFRHTLSVCLFVYF